MLLAENRFQSMKANKESAVIGSHESLFRMDNSCLIIGEGIGPFLSVLLNLEISISRSSLKVRLSNTSLSDLPCLSSSLLICLTSLRSSSGCGSHGFHTLSHYELHDHELETIAVGPINS